MAQRLPTRCNPDDRLNQRVLAGTMIKAEKRYTLPRYGAALADWLRALTAGKTDSTGASA